MKTALLSHTFHNRPGLRSIVLCGVSLEIRCRKAYRGHIFELNWFPCWLLTCAWSHWTAGARALRKLTSEVILEPHAHYLPRPCYQSAPTVSGSTILRAIAQAHK